MKTIIRNPARENGAVLIISLILLMIMTILAVTLSQSSTLQQRMAGNARDADAAFQASEAGLRAAEIALEATNAVQSCADHDQCFSNVKGSYPQATISTGGGAWWAANAREYGTVGTQDITNVHDDPLYIVAEKDVVVDSLIQDSPKRMYYEVSTHASGNTDTAAAITQSVYGKWSLH
jgi:type IV pilus assembly protein PilX